MAFRNFSQKLRRTYKEMESSSPTLLGPCIVCCSHWKNCVNVYFAQICSWMWSVQETTHRSYIHKSLVVCVWCYQQFIYRSSCVTVRGVLIGMPGCAIDYQRRPFLFTNDSSFSVQSDNSLRLIWKKSATRYQPSNNRMENIYTKVVPVFGVVFLCMNMKAQNTMYFHVKPWLFMPRPMPPLIFMYAFME